jgi:predicted nucleic acid-binding protein
MPAPILIDTGPIVALLCQSDRHHIWARERFAEIEPPLLTCEAVLSEADHLVRRHARATGIVVGLLRRGVLRLGFELAREIEAIAAIQARYQNRPASLADACLIRMSEIHDGSRVLTVDSDFRVYRRRGREVIPTWMPDGPATG